MNEPEVDAVQMGETDVGCSTAATVQDSEGNMHDDDLPQHDAKAGALSRPAIADATPERRGPGRPSAVAMEELSSVLRARLSMRGPLTADGAVGATIDVALRQALGRISAEARAAGVPAEHLLLAVKRLLNSMPELRAPEGSLDAMAARTLHGKVITACIEAYYAVDDATANASSDDATPTP